MQPTIKTIANDAAFLHRQADPVDFTKPNWKRDIETIEHFCIETQCFGLAAPQIGISKRIIYLKDTNAESSLDAGRNEGRIIINPTIISRRGHTRFWEACLSTGDYISLVDRPYEIILAYFNRNGADVRETFRGFESTVLSHELGHLDGIEHIDIANDIRVMSKDERVIFRKSHPYRILSKTCDFEPVAKKQMERCRA